jgi:hypothetical protein
MALFLEAESARALGAVPRSLALYRQAALRAREQGYRHHAALLCERRSDLLLAERRTPEASFALREAVDLYQEWEALAKVKSLRARARALKISID